MTVFEFIEPTPLEKHFLEYGHTTEWLIGYEGKKTWQHSFRDGRLTDKRIKKCPICKQAWEMDEGETIYYDPAYGIYKEKVKCKKCE